ncbi:MAG: AraC family transcriptional regulator, partial [Bacteroidaceae bacterium]|nr:AraC family transcriptional regulator [Bacteroidaceae bacterium]
TIQSIALEVGYSSINNFINTFKKMEGVTPAVYQRNAINKYFKKK